MMGELTAAVLGKDDGEHLLNASGEVVIKIDPRQGSAHLSLGTEHSAIRAGNTAPPACLLGRVHPCAGRQWHGHPE